MKFEEFKFFKWAAALMICLWICGVSFVVWVIIKLLMHFGVI